MSDIGRKRGPVTDKSGSSSTTASTVAAQNQYRKVFYFHNLDATIVQYICFGGTASSSAAGSIKVAAGASVQFDVSGFCPTDAVSVVAASGTPKYTAFEGND
jgi:hypothetical protein